MRRLLNQMTVSRPLGNSPVRIGQRVITIAKRVIGRRGRFVVSLPLLDLMTTTIKQHMIIASGRHITVTAILKIRDLTMRNLLNQMTVRRPLGNRAVRIGQRVITIAKRMISRRRRLIASLPLLDFMTTTIKQHMVIAGRGDIVVTAILKIRDLTMRNLLNQMTIGRTFSNSPVGIGQRIMTIRKPVIERRRRLVVALPLLDLVTTAVVQHMVVAGRGDVVVATVLEGRHPTVRPALPDRVAGGVIVHQRAVRLGHLSRWLPRHKPTTSLRSGRAGTGTYSCRLAEPTGYAAVPSSGDRATPPVHGEIGEPTRSDARYTTMTATKARGPTRRADRRANLSEPTKEQLSVVVRGERGDARCPIR